MINNTIRYHLGLDAEREGQMCAPFAMSMIRVSFLEHGKRAEIWKHVATHAIDSLSKEYGWTVLKTRECK